MARTEDAEQLSIKTAGVATVQLYVSMVLKLKFNTVRIESHYGAKIVKNPEAFAGRVCRKRRAMRGTDAEETCPEKTGEGRKKEEGGGQRTVGTRKTLQCGRADAGTRACSCSRWCSNGSRGGRSRSRCVSFYSAARARVRPPPTPPPFPFHIKNAPMPVCTCMQSCLQSCHNACSTPFLRVRYGVHMGRRILE